jgi:NADH-quinone oxidoreductase subunit G
MPEIFINGQPVAAQDGETVLQAALRNGYYIPYFCWHKSLSIAGNCRICVVQPEGKNWVEIACNMPVSEGMRVLTDSDLVKTHRKMTLQFITLNHPVDCGICDKAGECTLQDYHYEYNGERSISNVPKVQSTKFVELSSRIVLDNERCILCSRCVRFTREISKTNAIGIKQRGDESLVRASEDGALERDAYSDNVVDICPVGALLSRRFLHQARVWYLKTTPSVCPGCARGCAVDLWHRRPEWKLNALDPKQNVSVARVTPRENQEVNGEWICNKGRDLPEILGRARALAPMQKGKPVEGPAAIAAARALIEGAKKPVALVSSWGSNEELAAFSRAFAGRFQCFIKSDHQPAAGEVVEDDFLIKADKNPNTRGARQHFGDAPAQFADGTDLVLVWGEGCNFADLPRGAKVIFLNAWLAPENGHADVFIPVSIQTERAGHYTNFAGVVSGFEACFPKPDSVVDAEALFALLAPPKGLRA